MQLTSVRTRFAPSPSGLLHLGNARTALFNALWARHCHGVFLLRIEDTDAARSRGEYIQALEEDLRWLGLPWDEGPDTAGAYGPYLQSERGEVYERYFRALERTEAVYACFCSQEELARARSAQHAAGLPPRYPGTCALLSREEVSRRLALGERPAWRFRVGSSGWVDFDDLVRGRQRFGRADIGDFVVRRADGSAGFLFSNAVDDALMGITHVLRGEDHLSNTPRQILVLGALGLSAPSYGHVPLIVGADALPLAKRQGSVSVRQLRDEGYLPGAVLNYLARLGHSYDEPAWMDLDTLAAGFSLDRLGRAPARFDAPQLNAWQARGLTGLSSEAFRAWLGGEVAALVPQDAVPAFAEAIRENVMSRRDAIRWARILFSDPLALDERARMVIGSAGASFFEAALQQVRREDADLEALVRRLKEVTGAHGRALFQPLRAALTGEVEGPELARLLPLMGRERALQRLQRAARGG